MGAVSLIKLLKNMLLHIFRHSVTVIDNGNRKLSYPFADIDVNYTADRRMLDSIVKYVDPNLL